MRYTLEDKKKEEEVEEITLNQKATSFARGAPKKVILFVNYYLHLVSH